MNGWKKNILLLTQVMYTIAKRGQWVTGESDAEVCEIINFSDKLWAGIMNCKDEDEMKKYIRETEAKLW